MFANDTDWSPPNTSINFMSFHRAPQSSERSASTGADDKTEAALLVDQRDAHVGRRMITDQRRSKKSAERRFAHAGGIEVKRVDGRRVSPPIV